MVFYAVYSYCHLFSIGPSYYEGGYDIIGNEKHLVLNLLVWTIVWIFSL